EGWSDEEIGCVEEVGCGPVADEQEGCINGGRRSVDEFSVGVDGGDCFVHGGGGVLVVPADKDPQRLG
ncbi:hypothetical protein A2U01_0117677, partial [Trifolium medium]|nr:hypothetical protein [Trifolium medium]